MPQAGAALRAGEWKRSRYTGIELYEKTLGVVGLGRIGGWSPSGSRGSGCGCSRTTRTSPPAGAGQLGVHLVPLDELLAASDFISVHLPKTPDTVGLIGEEQLKQVKPTAVW